MTKVSNVSRLPQVVDIVLANGKKTSINVMPKARPTLPTGSKVSPNWLALNPGCVVLIEDVRRKSTEVTPVKEQQAYKASGKEQSK